MINAETAAKNVMDYNVKFYSAVEATTNEVLESMSKAIEFCSKGGLKSATFMPYTNSRYSNDRAKQIAKTIFEKVFKENGYTISENEISYNVLTIEW